MREILFRGKRVANGEWKYGYYAAVVINGKLYSAIDTIFNNRFVTPTTVYTETVGEYTGLTDKNGTRIFEGDIIEVDRIYDTLQSRPRRFEVEWEESSGFFPLSVCRDGGDYLIDTDSCEVVGNIWDNPELLEVTNEKRRRDCRVGK